MFLDASSLVGGTILVRIGRCGPIGGSVTLLGEVYY